MEYLLRNTNSIFEEFNAYIVLEKSPKEREVYEELERKMKKKINTLKSKIDSCIKIEKGCKRKLVESFFIEMSTFMDIVFEFFKQDYKIYKKRKFYSFFKEFKEDGMSFEDKEILNLSWYLEVAKMRNLIIHKNESIVTLEKDEKILIQYFDKIDFPKIISYAMNDYYYVDFVLYAIEKLNVFINFIKMIFNSIKKKSVYSLEKILEQSKKNIVYLDEVNDNKYYRYYQEFIKLKENCSKIKYEYIKFFNLFDGRKDSLEKIAKMIENGEFENIDEFNKAEVYYFLGRISYNEKNYSKGIEIFWKGYEEFVSISWATGLLYGYIEKFKREKIRVIKEKEKDRIITLIKKSTRIAYVQQDYNFFKNAAAFYEYLNENEKALNLLEIGISINKDELSYGYARSLKLNKKFIEARMIFNIAIEYNPKDYEAYFHRIDCNKELNETNLVLEDILFVSKFFKNNKEIKKRINNLLETDEKGLLKPYLKEIMEF